MLCFAVFFFGGDGDLRSEADFWVLAVYEDLVSLILEKDSFQTGGMGMIA